MNPITAIASGRLLSAAVIDSPDLAVPIAEALLGGGLGVMEVTLRNAHALECIRRIHRQVPEMVLGAGTLLTPQQLDDAREAGAAFGVSPGFNPTVVRHAVAQGFPFIPGVLTPGEMEQALELGCPVVKLFPASAIGRAEYIRALAAPYGHTPLRLIPIGGIGEHDLCEYLSLPLVIAVGGSWLTDRQLASRRNWEEMSRRTREAVRAAATSPRYTTSK